MCVVITVPQQTLGTITQKFADGLGRFRITLSAGGCPSSRSMSVITSIIILKQQILLQYFRYVSIEGSSRGRARTSDEYPSIDPVCLEQLL